ncbi:MAG TPA: LON peptidase substrate-binding domain-containing protein [Acidimicrobiia bacterium]|nr:LON peptidase substrate-binding domain-containing protein [Acidimicrobiia bacterium]
MFPLGTVLFPHAVLPLHVFEPRYRAMTEHCLANDARFGVVLIERGSEVGGGDRRFGIGTAARIVQAGRLDDGRWVLMTVGEHRVRISEWLTEDPYPQAIVEVLDEQGGPGAGALLPDLGRALQRMLALRTELGDPSPGVDVTLADDPVRASFEACALASLNPLDAQQLLELDDTPARLTRLATLVEEETAVLELRLAGG